MEDYKVYECPKCQIRKQIPINEKVNFKCKCCGENMKYITTVRKNKTEHGSNNYFKMQTITLSTQQNIPKCPTCGSTNIEKISLGKKAVGGALFGLFSKTARSQFRCEQCGYKW